MDQSFLFRAQRALAGRPLARLEHEMLVAAVATRQSSSATALRQTAAAAGSVFPRDGGRVEPLVELLLAGPEWRKAYSAQAGRFSRRAGQAANQAPDRA